MLTFASRKGGRTCDGVSRRSFLKLGSLCVGGDNDTRYDARRMVDLLIGGLRLR